MQQRRRKLRESLLSRLSVTTMRSWMVRKRRSWRRAGVELIGASDVYADWRLTQSMNVRWGWRRRSALIVSARAVDGRVV